jgi:hypothetical protein
VPTETLRGCSEPLPHKFAQVAVSKHAAAVAAAAAAAVGSHGAPTISRLPAELLQVQPLLLCLVTPELAHNAREQLRPNLHTSTQGKAAPNRNQSQLCKAHSTWSTGTVSWIHRRRVCC